MTRPCSSCPWILQCDRHTGWDQLAGTHVNSQECGTRGCQHVQAVGISAMARPRRKLPDAPVRTEQTDTMAALASLPFRAPCVLSLRPSGGLPGGRAAHIGEPLPEHTVSRKQGDQRGRVLAGKILFAAYGKNRSLRLGPGGRPGHSRAALSPSLPDLRFTPHASSPWETTSGPRAQPGGLDAAESDCLRRRRPAHGSVLLLPLPGPCLVSPTGPWVSVCRARNREQGRTHVGAWEGTLPVSGHDRLRRVLFPRGGIGAHVPESPA